ncbi:MAG: immunoglobulin-like domain-containing protein [bacterium]
MRKYKSAILVVSLVLAFAAVFAVVISFANNTGEKPIAGEKDICIEATPDGENGVLEIRIINEEETVITFGLAYEIEVYKNHKWSLYQANENVNLLGIAVPAHEQYIQTVSPPELKDFTPGVYRVVKTIGGERYFSNEFQIG